jgi:hypothetical protein
VALLALGNGTQFITGACSSDADCASGCCGFRSGKCAGPVIAQTRDGGCGFGDAQPNNNAAVAFFSSQGLAGTAPTPAAATADTTTPTADPASSANTNTGSAPQAGTQFITGPCTSDADCASSCCGFKSGKCAGPVIAQERDGGCGFGDAQPNNIAALAFFSSQSAAAAAAATPVAAAQAAPASSNKGPGNKAGTQFITGPCTSDADCASSCCGFKSGLCAGPVIAQTRDGGCGFGDAQPNNIAALAFFASQSAAEAAAATPEAAAAPAASPAAANADSSSTSSKGPGNKAGQQFITGACTSDADCASGCCGFKSGLCAGAIIAQERDGGCGFGDAQPNDNAAQALRGQGSTPTTMMTAVVASAAQGQSTNTGAGNGAGKQFITGPCLSDADCADGCCGFKSGKCAGPIVAQERDGGCGFGDAQPNDRAAQALRGQ